MYKALGGLESLEAYNHTRTRGASGNDRTKARLSEKVWWPNMDRHVEESTKASHPCQVDGPRSKTVPIRPTNLSEGPWTDIAVDMLEIPGGDHLLVVVDNYSRWSEVILLKKTDATQVTRAIEGLFQTHGLPLSVRSDNGLHFPLHSSKAS